MTSTTVRPYPVGMTLRRLALPLSVIAALVAVVASLLSIAAPTASAADFRTAQGGGITVSVPANWDPFALDTPKAKAALKSFLSTNSQLGFSYDELIKQNVVILAIGPRKGLFSDNLNVISSPSGGASTITAADLKGLEKQYEGIGGKIVKSQIVKVKGLPAARVEYTLPITAADGSKLNVQGTQLVVLGKTKLAFVTISQKVRDSTIVNTIVGSVVVP